MGHTVTVVCYTAVLGNRDRCRPAEYPLVYFTDDSALLAAPETASAGIEIRPARVGEATRARSARWHSANAHLAVPEADISIYHDGTHRLLVPPEELAALLGDADLAAPTHGYRNCVYEEAAKVLELRLDTPEVVDAQMARARAEGHPPHGGLWELTVLIRRHTPAVAAFNELWWAEIRRGSWRDQLSFPVVARRLGLTVMPLCSGGYADPHDPRALFDSVPHTGGAG